MNKLLLPIMALSSSVALAADGGFLFVTFDGEGSPMSEQIFFGLSKDGRDWEALNDRKPVLVSGVGEKGARDPYIVRSHDGKTFYLLATDLSINRLPDWNRATHAGSQSLLVWESPDLVHWSEPRLVKVAADDAGCTWAPEAVYDEDTRDYLVFWASMNKRDNFAKQRIWACRTRDFKTFGKPFIYIEKPNHVIDTDIVREDGKYYRFSKDERDKAITMEVSSKLMGPWQEVRDFSLAKVVGYEGPACFQLEPAVPGKPAEWCLLLDYYSKGLGYQPYVTRDLSRGQFAAAGEFKFPFRFRHGTVLPLTAAEYSRLKTAFVPTAPAAAPQPILDGNRADPDIRVFGDTYYIYPTSDKPGWQTTDFSAWSSKDLIQWKNEGVILDVANDLKWANIKAWAPAATARNGKYYFYFVANDEIGVATSDKPTGPFMDALGKPLIGRRQFGTHPIDPFVFTDTNGQSYLYFGNSRLLIAKLNDDMVSLASAPLDITPADPAQPFREGIVVFRRNGLYYFMWSVDDANSDDYRVAYGTSKSPFGPIQIPPNNVVLAKHGTAKGTGHNGIVNVPGTDRWYFAYHRHAIPGGDGYTRQVCLARLEFKPDGTIKPIDPLVPPFPNGSPGEPLRNGKGRP